MATVTVTSADVLAEHGRFEIVDHVRLVESHGDLHGACRHSLEVPRGVSREK
jgi:hypothetical protein